MIELFPFIEALYALYAFNFYEEKEGHISKEYFNFFAIMFFPFSKR